MNYNHKSAIAQMAKEYGCNDCYYFHPDEPRVCQRPNRKFGITTDFETGKCLNKRALNKGGRRE